MVNANQVVSIAIAALVVVVLFGVAPMIGTTIDDTYSITDTSDTGWNASTNTNLDTPAQSWSTFQGLIVLGMLAVIIGLVIGGFRMLGGRDSGGRGS